MNHIDTELSSSQKVAIAKSYAARLLKEHPAIDSIIMSGSVVRGEDIPVSDVDLGYLVKRDTPILPVQKGFHQGVYIDIEPFYIEDLELSQVMKDGYVKGYIEGSLTLFDRYGTMAELKEQIERASQNPYHKREQLAAIQHRTVRNINEFTTAIDVSDAGEICRAAIFAVWCFAEFLLVRHNKSPGGFRCLSRLKMVNTDAFIEIAAFQDSLDRDRSNLNRFGDIYFGTKQANSYIFQKYAWMNRHGFKDEAFHMLWILLGLALKDKQAKERYEMAQRWLEELGWNEAILRKKHQELEDLIWRYGLTNQECSQPVEISPVGGHDERSSHYRESSNIRYRNVDRHIEESL